MPQLDSQAAPAPLYSFVLDLPQEGSFIRTRAHTSEIILELIYLKVDS